MQRLEVCIKAGTIPELTPDLVLALYMLCGKLSLGPRSIDFRVIDGQPETHIIKIDTLDSPSISLSNGAGKPPLAKQIWEYLGTPVEYDALIQTLNENKEIQNLVTGIIARSESTSDALDHLFTDLDILKEGQGLALTELKNQEKEYEEDFKSAGGEIETITLEDASEFKIAAYTGKFRYPTRTWLFTKIGVHYLVYKSGLNMGVMRNKDQQRFPCPSLCNLFDFVQNDVSVEEFNGRDGGPGWFFFEDLAGRGTEHNPVSTSSRLSLDNFIEILKKFIADALKE